MLSSAILDELTKNRDLIGSFVSSHRRLFDFSFADDNSENYEEKVSGFYKVFDIIEFATNFGMLKSKINGEIDTIAYQFIEETHKFMTRYMSIYNSPTNNKNKSEPNSIITIIDFTTLIRRYTLSHFYLMTSYDHCIRYIHELRGEIKSPENSTITYTFSSNLSRAEDIENIISTINRAYQLLCFIAGEDADTLHIIRLETGSLEAAFTGIKKVIIALGGIYRASLRYFIRHLHQDGAIMKNEELLRLLNSELQTYGLMKENGLDVTKIDGSLQETLQTIAINIGALAQMPTGAVRINGELIVNGDEVKNLESPDIKKLPS